MESGDFRNFAYAQILVTDHTAYIHRDFTVYANKGVKSLS